MAFLTNQIRDNAVMQLKGCGFGAIKQYISTISFDSEVYEKWIEGSFTKVSFILKKFFESLLAFIGITITIFV